MNIEQRTRNNEVLETHQYKFRAVVLHTMCNKFLFIYGKKFYVTIQVCMNALAQKEDFIMHTCVPKHFGAQAYPK